MKVQSIIQSVCHLKAVSSRALKIKMQITYMYTSYMQSRKSDIESGQRKVGKRFAKKSPDCILMTVVVCCKKLQKGAMNLDEKYSCLQDSHPCQC